MKTIELDMYQATAVAALVLLLGRVLVAKISILRRYCIPAPVVGGFLYAIVHHGRPPVPQIDRKLPAHLFHRPVLIHAHFPLFLSLFCTFHRLHLFICGK